MKTGDETYNMWFSSFFRLWFAITSENANLLAHSGLSLFEIRVLYFIFFRDSVVKNKMIAADLNVTDAAATQIVDRLVAKGYLQKNQKPGDRRSVDISFTLEGKMNFVKLKEKHISYIKSQFSSLTPDELKQLTSIQNKIFTQINKNMP